MRKNRYDVQQRGRKYKVDNVKSHPLEGKEIFLNVLSAKRRFINFGGTSFSF